MTEIVVLADTHIRRNSSRRLPAAVYEALEGADLVLHAGDVVTGVLLEELAGFAPTVAVLGNNDGELAGQRLFNPGSPTERRPSTPYLSFGRLRIDDGHLVGHRLVRL